MRSIRLKLPSQSKLVLIEEEGIHTLKSLWDTLTKMNLNVDFEKSKFIDKRTKAEYTNNGDALLPQGDCLLYVVPIKNDSGSMDDAISRFLGVTKEMDLHFIYYMDYNTIRKFGTALNKEMGFPLVNTRGTVRSMLKELQDYAVTHLIEGEVEVREEAQQELLTPVAEDNSNLVDLLSTALNILQKAKELAIEFNYVVGYTLQHLQDEHEKLIELNSKK